MLHIVSFNVPFPANYGGVIDVYHRIRALASLGVDISLHTFTYGRPPAPRLEQLCRQVRYYRRNMSPLMLLTRRPFIVSSRDSNEMLSNILANPAPVLLEGLHCCALLQSLKAARYPHKVLVRAHNVEHDYYSRLADAERNPLRRLYLRADARKLRRYESVLTLADTLFAVTEADAAHFRSIGCPNVILMPSSHPDDDVVSQTGLGHYALYHADLSVPENIKAVRFLLDNVFNLSAHRLVVAGRNPDSRLRQRIARFRNVSLVANPDDSAMQALVAGAQVNILVTNQPTGLKLKLLNSLYAGRHCLVNSNMVAGTPLGQLCTVADDSDHLMAALDSLMRTPFTLSDICARKALLDSLYSNSSNARKILAALP